MASPMIIVQSCSKCPKGHGQVTCGGCQQWFCMKHLLEHRQELGQQMDDLTLKHDQLRQTLTVEEKDYQHPLIVRVNTWEMESIRRIQEVANKVRSHLEETLIRTKRNIQASLNEITKELQENRQSENYTEIDLSQWFNQLRELKEQLEKPSKIELMHDEDDASSTHIPIIQLRITKYKKVPSSITDKTQWSDMAHTVAGGHRRGDELNQIHCPLGLDIDEDGTLFIADTYNHRIMRWEPNATQGEIVAGGNGQGNRNDQLNKPFAVLIDRTHGSLIISDRGNRRVMRWSLFKHDHSTDQGQVIIPDIISRGLAIDSEGSLYVSDFDKHEVRRYGYKDGKEGVVVAGGNGQGAALNQLDGPQHLFVDDDRSVYVSDKDNHRVMKWSRGAKEGVVVAGGHGQGKSLGQLDSPSGIFVDQMGSVYVADQGSHRLMRWLKDAKEGEMIADGNGSGIHSNQFELPGNISFDNQGNLYVVDHANSRIQRLDIR